MKAFLSCITIRVYSKVKNSYLFIRLQTYHYNLWLFYVSIFVPFVQDKGGTSIDGPVIDRFIESGSGYKYLHARNQAPGAAKGILPSHFLIWKLNDLCSYTCVDTTGSTLNLEADNNTNNNYDNNNNIIWLRDDAL